MFRTSLALTLMASLIFAGCLEGGGTGGLETSSSPAPEGSSSPSPEPESTAPPSTSAAPPPSDTNERPEADLVVKENETVIAPDSGVIMVDAPGPLVFDASNSTDADDDELSFVWTVDGEVDESLEGDVVEITLTPGTHAIAVEVSDGSLSDEREVIVTIGGLPVAVPPVGADGAVTSYRFEGDFDATVMAAPVTEEDVQQLHSFVMPSGAQKLVVYMQWGDNVSVPDEGSIGPLLPFPAGNLDLRLVDALGAEAAAADAVLDYEYVALSGADKLGAGSWVVAVDPIVVAAPVHYSLDIIVFRAAPTLATFEGTMVGQQMITNLAPEDLPPDGVPALHTVTVPAGVKAVVARLTWVVPEEAPLPGQVASNLDFTASLGEDELLSADHVFAYEFDSLVSASGVPAGDWVFEITPLASPAAEYTLTVEFL